MAEWSMAVVLKTASIGDAETVISCRSDPPRDRQIPATICVI
jgi:hypothetical protein